jgi:hypothetical protein
MTGRPGAFPLFLTSRLLVLVNGFLDGWCAQAVTTKYHLQPVQRVEQMLAIQVLARGQGD